MKIFLDTSHIPTIKEWVKTGILDGVTTNPTNLSKEKSDPVAIIKEIASILGSSRSLSVEVTETKAEDIYRQAHEIAKIAPNISVKIPCYKDYYEVIDRLVKEGVSINITLVFTLTQALAMCKLGVDYISPFVGRLDAYCKEGDGAMLLHVIRNMIDRYGFKTQVLAASLRTVEHFNQAILARADVATMSADVLSEAMHHELTDQGIKKFVDDWGRLGIVKFP